MLKNITLSFVFAFVILTYSTSAAQTKNNLPEISITAEDIVGTSIALDDTRMASSHEHALSKKNISIQIIGNRMMWDAKVSDIQGYRIQYSKYGFEWSEVGRLMQNTTHEPVLRFTIDKTGYYRLMTIEQEPVFSTPLFHKSEDDKIKASPYFLKSMENDIFLSDVCSPSSDFTLLKNRTLKKEIC